MSTEDPTPATDDEIPDLDALAEVGLATEAGESSDAASPDYEASDAAADEAVALSEASSEDEAASLGEAAPATDETSLDEAPPSDEAAAQPEAPQQETPAESTSDSTNEDQLPPDDPESDLVAAGDENELPDVSSDEALEAALEALLLVVDSPINEESLGETVGVSVARVTVALRTMAQKFTERASGIDLRRVGEGWRFYTRD
ncbi:MAG TPA: SMC-Scp complex subunit ScpB, partial [Amycolatopsis sp.]